MADSLKTRVGRVIAASANALVSSLENQAPVALMQQAIREVEGITLEVRHQLGQISANHHLAQQQHASLSRQHEDLVDKAQQALKENREDLASAAISRQLDIEAQLPVLQNTLAELSRKEEELSSYVAALLGKQREMEQALHEFSRSREATASTGGKEGSAATAQGDQQQRLEAASGAFDRLYQHHSGISPAAAGASLEQAAKLKELEDLVRQNQINERLARLRSNTPPVLGKRPS